MTRSRFPFPILILGLIFLVFAFVELKKVWVSDSDLIQVRGRLLSVRTYVHTAKDRTGHESQVSELVFFINSGEQQFKLVQNIGDSFYDEEFEKIKKELSNAESIAVSIKRDEVSIWQPKVFAIVTNKAVLLKAEDVKDEGKQVMILLFALGLGMLVFAVLSMRFPNFRK